MRARPAGYGLLTPVLALLIAGFLAPTAIMALLSLRSYSGMQGFGDDWTLALCSARVADWADGSSTRGVHSPRARVRRDADEVVVDAVDEVDQA